MPRERGITVMARMPSTLRDQLIEIASRDGNAVSATIRRLLMMGLAVEAQRTAAAQQGVHRAS
jgi:hypothetical protein